MLLWREVSWNFSRASGTRHEQHSRATEAFGANSKNTYAQRRHLAPTVKKYFCATAAFGVNSEELGQYFRATEQPEKTHEVQRQILLPAVSKHL